MNKNTQSKKSRPDCNKNIEIIEIDLIRSEFIMPKNSALEGNALKVAV